MAAVSPSMTTRKWFVLADHSGGLARVDHSGVDLLPGDHEPAPGRHSPLHGDGPTRLWREGPAAAGTAQPGTAVGWDGAGRGAQQRPVVAENRHQGSFHAQGDPLPGQWQANTDLLVAQAEAAVGVDGAVHLDHCPIPGRQRRGACRTCAVGGQPGQLSDPEPGWQGPDPGAIEQHVQADRIGPEGDLPPGQGRAKPDLLPADPQVPRGRNHPIHLHRRLASACSSAHLRCWLRRQARCWQRTGSWRR
jgi:hypothetical protein